MDPLGFSNKQTSPADPVLPSLVAVSIGIIPFTVAIVGRSILNGLINVARATDDICPQNKVARRIIHWSIGVPATISTAVFLSGTYLFAKSQELVWGKNLVANPQIPGRTNARLAQFGATNNLWNVAKTILAQFFTEPSISSGNATARKWKTVKL